MTFESFLDALDLSGKIAAAVVIALGALAEVFPSWVGVGASSGFPHLGRIPTDWDSCGPRLA